MLKLSYNCDRCKQEELTDPQYNLPKGWYRFICVQMPDKPNIHYDVCNKCNFEIKDFITEFRGWEK